MLELDKVDRRILFFMDHGGRLSYSEISRQVALGRDLVEYRIKRMIDGGVITGFRTILNPYRLGLTFFKTYLRLSELGAKKDRFLASLASHPQVFWVTQCDGEWDIIFSIAADSVFRFSQLQREILNSVSDSIVASEVYPVVQFKFFRLKYLFRPGTHFFLIGGEPADIEIDQTDRAILKELDRDARASQTDLAERVSVSPATIRERISTLEERGIIVGYQTEISPAALGQTQFKCQLYLRDLSIKEEERIYNFCNNHPRIVEVISQVGRCRLEINLHAENYQVYLKTISSIRDEFPDQIRNTVPLMTHHEHYRWLLELPDQD